METTAILKGIRLSAQKGRLVADQIRGLPVEKAINILITKPTCHIELTVSDDRNISRTKKGIS